MPCVQRSLYLNEVTNNFASMKVEVPRGVDAETRDVLERCMATCRRAAGTKTKRRSRARKEASAQEVRGYYKQFTEAKHREYKSWVTRRWVLTSKTDKQENFLKVKARWVLRGFHDKQKEYHHTDSPASTRPGFRMTCPMAASNTWNVFHIDLKTAFLQGQSYGVNRDIVCQLPPEASHPPDIAARLKKLAYRMNDASRCWWNIMDKALCSYGMVPTRADRCCYVFYSNQT